MTIPGSSLSWRSTFNRAGGLQEQGRDFIEYSHDRSISKKFIEALRERLEKREITGITFLVKGSRGTRLERAIPALL